MRNTVYTTITNDSWFDDVEDLLGALNNFWKPYKFEVVPSDTEGFMDVVAVDDRVEPTEMALKSFDVMCGVITMNIRMWIDGNTVGRYKERR